MVLILHNMRHQKLVEVPSSAREVTVSTESKSRPALIIGAHMSLQKERRVLSGLQVLYILMALVAVGTGLGAVYGCWRLGGKQLFAVACFSVVPVIASIVSLAGARKAKQELGMEDQVLVRIQQVVGEDIHLLGFCHNLYAFSGFTVLGIACGLMRSQVESSLREEDLTPGLWALRHPYDSLEDTILLSQNLYGLLAGGCLLYAALTLVAAGFITWLSIDNEFTHTVVQIIDSAQVFVGLFLAFASEFTYRVSQDIAWSGLPPLILRTSLLLAVLSVLCSVYSFLAAKNETAGRIQLSILLKIIHALGLAGLLLHSAAQYPVLHSSISTQCTELMEVLDSDYLSHLGCEDKYTAFRHSPSFKHCPKSRIRLSWEKNTGENRLYDTFYGCMDETCCVKMRDTTLGIADYVASCMVTQAVLLVAGSLVSFALLRKLSRRGPSLFHSADLKIALVVLLALVLGPAALYASLPLTLVPKPDLQPSLIVDSAGELPDIMNPDLTFCAHIHPGISLQPDILLCDCDWAELRVVMQTSTGEVLLDDSRGVNVQGDGTQQVVITGTDLDSLSRVLDSTYLCGFCYNSFGNMTINVSRIEHHGTETREIQLYSESPVVAVPTRTQAVLSGTTLTQGVPLSAVHIQVTDFRGVCDYYETKSSSKGYFELEIPVGVYGVTPFRVSFRHLEYMPVNITTTDMHNQEVELLPYSSHMAAVQVSLYDPAVWNSPIPNAEVVLSPGYSNTTGLGLYHSRTNIYGNAVFPEVPVGYYTASCNVSSLTTDLTVRDTNLTLTTAILPLPPPVLTPNQVTFMLIWPDESLDLDLNAYFYLRPDHFCNLSYVNKQCGGTTLTSELITAFPGIEILNLFSISASRYSIFIHKNDTNLSFSSAKMQVFAGSKLISTLLAPSVPGSVWFAYCLKGTEGVSGLIPVNIVGNDTENPCEIGVGETWDWQPSPVHVPLQSEQPAVPANYVFKPGF